MKERTRLTYISFIAIVPMILVLLSINMISRISSVYVYYFNDSQSVDKLYTSVTGDTFAKKIASYFNAFNLKAFQVYEVNGKYKDPFFKSEDQVVMYKFKVMLTISLIILACLVIISIFLYRNLLKYKEIDKLRKANVPIGILTIAFVLLINIFTRISVIKNTIYNKVIGITLSKKSSLDILLGNDFFNTYTVFLSITIITSLFLFIYINLTIAKKNTIFS